MQPTRSNKTLFFALLGIALLCFGLWFLRVSFASVAFDVQDVSSENGVWDLRDFDFENGFVQLKGDGETILNDLLSPEDFEARANETRYGGYQEALASSTRLRILLPDDSVYMLLGQSIDYAERIYVNGSWQLDVGQVGLSAAESRNNAAYFMLEAPARGGKIEIVRQSSNYQHRTLRDPVNFRIGSPEIMQQVAAMETDLTGFVMGMFFTLFLCHGLLYVIMRRYKANLYFALLCLCWCVRFGVTGAYLIPTWFPKIPWNVFLRIEYTFVAVAAVCIVFIIAELFPTIIPKWLKRFTVAFSAAYLVMCLLTPTLPLSYLWIPCAGIYILCGLYIIFLLSRYFCINAKKGLVQPEQWIMLISFLALAITATHDVFYYTGLSSLGIINGLGFLLFAFFQMAAHFYGTMREIEKAHRSEQAIRLETETLKKVSQMKEEFLHNLSHELQMPITVVSGFAQLTESMIEDPSPDREVIRDNMCRIVEEAERMEQLVSSLLDAAAMENGTFTLHCKRLDIGVLIRDVAEIHFPIMDEKNNRIVLDIEDDLLTNGDRERLLQVLLNLLSNALKHTENGTIFIAASQDRGMARVQIKDSGSGISPELLPKLFQRFVKQSSAEGNGLGLYICRQIVEAHGGQINIESDIGKGTSATFTIPLWKEES